MATLDVCGFLRGTYWQSMYQSSRKSPRRVEHDVPLVQQLSSWDCGLACIRMALKFEKGEDLTLDSLTELCQTQSIWTIDLAYLLKRVGLNFVFLTKTLGADPDFSSLAYYSPQMLQDQQRVNSLFHQSQSENVPILQQSLHIDYLRQIFLSSCCLIVLLVNDRKLRALINDDVYWVMHCMNLDLGTGEEMGYQGHYILVTGYDEGLRKFHVHDPIGHCYWISDFVLDHARCSYGTDEDMIIVYTSERQE